MKVSHVHIFLNHDISSKIMQEQDYTVDFKKSFTFSSALSSCNYFYFYSYPAKPVFK